MRQVTRRGACQAGLALLAGTSVGCLSGGKSDLLQPGESVAVNDGLKIAYTDYMSEAQVRPVESTGTTNESELATPSESVPTTTENGTGNWVAGTPLTAGEKKRLLAIKFSMNNDSSDPTQAPMPRWAPPYAEGKLGITLARKSTDPNSIGVGPWIEIGDQTVPSLAHRLAPRRAEISPGETITGWAVFPVPAQVDLSEVIVEASGTKLDHPAGVLRWSLTPSS